MIEMKHSTQIHTQVFGMVNYHICMYMYVLVRLPGQKFVCDAITLACLQVVFELGTLLVCKYIQKEKRIQM